jgi:mono/diheme cytochrome c family protein
MWNQSRLKPLEESPMLEGRSSSETLVPGTVPRGEPPADATVVTGLSGGKLATRFPFPITEAVVKHGQERFNVYCSPCHGRLGDGQGMIVKRGFPPPPDYAIPRLRKAPVGHFFDVITNGYGAMYSYASRVPPKDRWAIAAYIRALQATRPVVPVELDREKRLKAREMGIGTRPVDESMEPAEGRPPATEPGLPAEPGPGGAPPASGGEAPARGNP